MKWYFKVLRQYADFSGRARRKEYWMFMLFNMPFLIVAIAIDNAFEWTIGALPYGVFSYTYLISMLIPGLALTVRRLHDTGKSGWMALVGFIPFIGGLCLLVLLVLEGKAEENKYGENPKEFDRFSPLRCAKSVARALIIASVIDIIAISVGLGLLLSQQNISFANFILMAFIGNAAIIPIGMLIFGISLLPKYSKTKLAPVVLLVTSASWLLLKVLYIVRLPIEAYSLVSVTSMLAIVTPIALLAVGILMLQKKGNFLLPSICLLIGCLLGLASSIFFLITLVGDAHESVFYAVFYLRHVGGVLLTIALVVFAVSLIRTTVAYEKGLR